MDYVYYEDGLGDVDAFNCPCVLLASFNFHSLPFVGANYYCESGGVNLPTTSMAHYGTDLAASLATAMTTLPNHGFIPTAK